MGQRERDRVQELSLFHFLLKLLGIGISELRFFSCLYCPIVLQLARLSGNGIIFRTQKYHRIFIGVCVCVQNETSEWNRERGKLHENIYTFVHQSNTMHNRSFITGFEFFRSVFFLFCFYDFELEYCVYVRRNLLLTIVWHNGKLIKKYKEPRSKKKS